MGETNVPLKVGDLYVPVDFVIFMMEEDTSIPIIICRPSLTTTECHINVKNGKLPFNVWDDYVELNLLKDFKFPSICDKWDTIDVIET